jgi:hypothetical protein
MRHRVIEPAAQAAPAATYEFRYRGAWNRLGMTCHPEGGVPGDDDHEAFVLEHYWGYCRQRNGGTREYRVEHPRWNVWRASQVEIDCDFGAVYGPQLAQALGRQPHSAFLADGSAITLAQPRTIA